MSQESNITLVLATHNRGKYQEILAILQDLPIRLLSTADFPGCPESKEPFDTYLENAQDKARLVGDFTGHWALADDSGLEVAALNGAPGVKSARYAGESAKAIDNNQKLIKALAEKPGAERAAQFLCTMVLRSPKGQEWVRVGKLTGEIALSIQGGQGFGYDPVFWLPQRQETLSDLSFEEKNQISHRYHALEGIRQDLKEILKNT